MILTLVLITIFCSQQNAFFHQIIKYRQDLTTKQQAYILSIKSSICMFCIGLLYNYKWLLSNFCLDTYHNNLTSYDHIIQKLVIIYFSSYLIMDSVIGAIYYKKYMQSLSGYIHHFVYLCINVIAISTKQYPFFLLFMLEELPTILLSVGSYNHTYRSDLLFGITFFLTRIVFHVFLIYNLYRNNCMLVFNFAVCVLFLHIYWFHGWIKKYTVYKKT